MACRGRAAREEGRGEETPHFLSAGVYLLTGVYMEKPLHSYAIGGETCTHSCLLYSAWWKEDGLSSDLAGVDLTDFIRCFTHPVVEMWVIMLHVQKNL